MKNYFINDYPPIQLSKYFLLFLNKKCQKLGFHLYYDPSGHFILSDQRLDEVSYHRYKTNDEGIDSQDKYSWQNKTIVLFDKEEPFEQDDGEWFYPTYYDCQHALTFKMTIPNLQKILLEVFQDPILQHYYHSLQEIFPNHDITIFFPSETLKVDEKFDFLLIQYLDKDSLFRSMMNKHNDKILQILQKKSDNYLTDFFKLFNNENDWSFKNFILQVTQNENTLEKIFTHFPCYQKYLSKNHKSNFLSKETQQVLISKSYFNIENLEIKYHDLFQPIETKTFFLKVFETISIKEAMADKGIIIYPSFYDNHSGSVISFIENNSPLPIEKIEKFFYESLSYIHCKNGFYNNNQPDLLKFFDYYYQKETLPTNNNIKKSTTKI